MLIKPLTAFHCKPKFLNLASVATFLLWHTVMCFMSNSKGWFAGAEGGSNHSGRVGYSKQGYGRAQCQMHANSVYVITLNARKGRQTFRTADLNS